jgi:hypothetical protein
VQGATESVDRLDLDPCGTVLGVARRAHEEQLVRSYHDALVAAGVTSYPFDECWDEYACSLLSALLTTIFGAMYGARTERGDRMFEVLGARHARQILDLGGDRFLDGS